MSVYHSVWNVIGRQYEVLVYERSRLLDIEARRDATGVQYKPAPETNIHQKIYLTEKILAALAELKELENEI